MNERETLEIVTPIGNKKVLLKAWLTGRELRVIRSVLLGGINFAVSPEEKTTPDYNFDGATIDKMQDASINTIVISIDGIKEDILNQILDMHKKDFEFILEETDKISNAGTSEEGKKK